MGWRGQRVERGLTRLRGALEMASEEQRILVLTDSQACQPDQTTHRQPSQREEWQGQGT